jgi:hypothetical protein
VVGHVVLDTMGNIPPSARLAKGILSKKSVIET